MPKLSDLGLTNEQIGEVQNYADAPDQMGAFAPPPQPGTYRFKLPSRLDDLWEIFDHPNGKPPGKRIRARFDDAHPLLIIQSPGGVHDGEPFQTSLSNAERPRGRKDDPARVHMSDMDYVFRDVFDYPTPPKSNPLYAAALQKHANAELTADIEWNWFCNNKKPIFVENGQGGFTEVPTQPGCGTTYYQTHVEKVASDPTDPASAKVFPLRITCQCGANVRAFANLTRFRK